MRNHSRTQDGERRTANPRHAGTRARRPHASPAPAAAAPAEPEDVDDAGPFEDGELSLDAQPSTPVDADVAAAMAADGLELDGNELAADSSIGRDADTDEPEHDTGDLYGVRSPHAGDTDLSAPEHLDSFEGADRGENWLEALAEHATESGPEPEEEVVIIDDSDAERGHSATQSGDRPVADKGSGGPGGL